MTIAYQPPQPKSPSSLVLTFLVAALSTVQVAVAAPASEPATNRSKAPVIVDRVRFFPAPNRAEKMVGGKISGSNVSPTKGFTVLAEITSTPKTDDWTELTFTNTVPYRWVRYEAPPGSHGNIAELEFYSGKRKLGGGGFGTAGFVAPGAHWKAVFDGKTGTWFNSNNADGQYVGLDLGDQAATARPVLLPGFGDYADPQKVTLKCPTPGAVIRYTLDGTVPGADEGIAYSEPISITKTTSVVAVAFSQGLACSPAMYGTYSIGPSSRPPINTFHVGNSLTGNTHNFPMYARAAGYIDHYQSFLIGGALTAHLWEAKDTTDKARWESILAKVTWPLDDFTLQPRDFNLDAEVDSDIKFIDLMRAKSPDVQPWLYSEWVEMDRARPSDKGEVPSHEMKKVFRALTWEESMSAMLLYNEEVQWRIAQRDHTGKRVRIIPSDIALGWARNMIDHGQFPGVDPGQANFYATLFEDHVHVNANGSYLVDLTWYAAFFRESPEGKVPPIGTTLTAEQAAIFQRLAWDVVKNYPDVGLYEEGQTPVATPQFSPASEASGKVIPVTLNCSTPGAWFRYTLDGTTPTRTNGYLYCGVISVRPGMTVKAISFKSGMADGPVAESTYPAK